MRCGSSYGSGTLLWLIEVEGFQTMLRRQYGPQFVFAPARIMGWDDVKTVDDLYQMQKKVNYAPRIRFGDKESEPTVEERAAGKWDDMSRAWFPVLRNIELWPERKFEYHKTGRTSWED